MRLSISSLLTLVAAATAVVVQPSKRAPPLNPPKAYIHEVKWDALPPAPTEPVTNTKRFAQGLPPLSTRRRNPNRTVYGGAVHARAGTRVASAPRAEISSPPLVTQKCNIRVKDASSGAELGYISREWNSFAEYGPLQSSRVGALEVQFDYSPSSPNQLNLIITNGMSRHHPYFGASVGFGSEDENVSSGSTNYLTLTGNTRTPRGSPPSYDAENSFSEVTGIPVASESAIWSYDPGCHDLTPVWINTEGVPVKIANLWSTDQEGNKMFTLVGNVDLFKSTFGNDAPEVTFTCEPPVAVV